MEIINFEKEFVKRTKSIIEDKLADDFLYHVTLLLNCLVGLISLPTEMTEDEDKEFKEICVNKLKNMNVIIAFKNNDKLFRAIRNSISHMNIELKNKDSYINTIVFKDRECHREYKEPIHTKLEFTVPQLKEFALFIADKHLERCEKQECENTSMNF